MYWLCGSCLVHSLERGGVVLQLGRGFLFKSLWSFFPPNDLMHASLLFKLHLAYKMTGWECFPQHLPFLTQIYANSLNKCIQYLFIYFLSIYSFIYLLHM